MSQVSRRDVIRGAGVGAALGLAGVGVGVSQAATAYESLPDHVTLEYDESALETYRPRLVTASLDIRPSTLYAWVARSTEEETTMYCYWAWYVSQQGVAAADSHVPDREPVYVEVDDSTGDVVAVYYDQYHYLRTTARPPVLSLYDETHPQLHVIDPWHPYRPTETVGSVVSLDNMHSVYEGWIENGWTVHQPAVVNPWLMKSRTHWWPEGSLGLSLTAELSKASLALRDIAGFDPLSLIGRST